MFYEDVFRKLSEDHVQYVVVGGVALVLHGVVRLTADLDLFLKMETANIGKFVRIMKELGYQPKAPVPAEDLTDAKKRRQWKDEKGMQVFSFYHARQQMHLIDVFIDEPMPYDAVDLEKRVVEAAGIRIPVVSVQHLVQLKRMSGRPQDLADIKALENITGG